MGSKMGFILSLLFLVQLFALLGDMLSVQIIYNNLDAVSVNAGYLISRYGKVTPIVTNYVSEEAGATVVAISEGTGRIGDVYKYKISKTYKPLIIKNEDMEIAVMRSIIIGYYSQKGGEHMSEIKGQLLGIILTISIFGIVAAAMATSFTNASKKIGDQVENVATTEVTAEAQQRIDQNKGRISYKIVY